MNIALHAISALLVWRILERLRIPGALFAAAIFALHPVNVESVAWIAQLKNTLSLPLALLSLLFFLRHEREGGWWRLALSLGLFLLSALAKGMTLTLPVVLLACAWWQRGSHRATRSAARSPFPSHRGVDGGNGTAPTTRGGTAGPSCGPTAFSAAPPWRAAPCGSTSGKCSGRPI